MTYELGLDIYLKQNTILNFMTTRGTSKSNLDFSEVPK